MKKADRVNKINKSKLKNQLKIKRVPTEIKPIHYTLMAIVAGIFFIAIMFLTFNVITEHIIKISLENLEELAEHDEHSLEANIKSKWDEMETLGENLKAQNIKSAKDLTLQLSTNRLFFDSLMVMLISDDGDTVGSNFVIGQSKMYQTMCATSNERFVKRMQSPREQTQGSSGELVYGVRIEPFTVEGKTYTHVLARLDIDSIQNMMKLDCYDGRGKSRIINLDGEYIVDTDRNHTPQNKQNFFLMFQNGKLLEKFTVEQVRQKMNNFEKFSLRWESSEGEKFIISFVPMKTTNWYFVTRVPMQVFLMQGFSLLKIILLFTFILLGIVVTMMFLLFRKTFQLLATEQQYHKELTEAVAMADQANKAKTVFLNNMSHDIRTPMNAIIGYTNLAAQSVTNVAVLQDYLSKIAQSSDHLLKLINDVLDMSRIEAGKINIVERPENLRDILQQIRTLVLADIRSKNLNFFINTVDVADENIICDKLHLNQVLLNLLSNSMKFTKDGGSIFLGITEKNCENDTATYEFSVKDTGIGMSKDFIKTIFEPFTREQTDEVNSIQGTGLGMSITKNIVDEMHGSISVTSEVGKGTEFIVNFTFRLQGDRNKISIIPSLQNKRSLVVDDDENSCKSVSSMLEKMGINGEYATNGEDAVEKAKSAKQENAPFSIFIIDYLMKDINGVETAKRIRKIAGKDAAIILLSAYDITGLKDNATGDITEFLNKPIFPSELYSVLSNLSGDKPMATSSIKKDEKTATDRAIGNAENSNADNSAFQNMRLLVVEDNEINREIASKILTTLGFIVDTANNGLVALQIIKDASENEYDAVLMDLKMPVMDGFEATKKIRGLPNKKLASIPIIALTANAFGEDKIAALDAGMNAHVEKPINIKTLIETLRQVLLDKKQR